MATSDNELRAEVRDFTGIDAGIVTDPEFATVLSDSKRHIKLKRSLSDTQVDWYGDPAQEEALNWTVKLFLKVAAGELDATSVQVGAIDHDSLLASEGEDVTLWFRNYKDALHRVNPGTSYGIGGVDRGKYSNGDDDSGSGGVSL